MFGNVELKSPDAQLDDETAPIQSVNTLLLDRPYWVRATLARAVGD